MLKHILGFCTFAPTACVTHVPLALQYDGPDTLPAGMLGEPREAFAPVVVSDEQIVKDRLRFSVRHVSLPSNVDTRGTIDFEYYDVDSEGRTPIVVLLPIFNGQLMITRYFARYFANQGWRALVVVRERDPLAAMEAPETAIRANLLEYQRVLDWVEQQPEVDPSRIGLFGISFGAIDAVMLTALDDRVDALVAAMAGGDLPNLLMNTSYRRVERLVDRWLAKGGTREALLDTFAVATDPLALAPYVDAQRVLMILTRSDAIVPFEAQQALRASMGTPETLYLPTGHRPSVVYFPKLRSAALEFFERQFRREFIATER